MFGQPADYDKIKPIADKYSLKVLEDGAQGFGAHSPKNPEEINRICTDHISSLLLPCTQSSMDELNKEGLGEVAGQITGDLMYDVFLKYRNRLHKKDIVLVDFDKREQRLPKDYYYLTCHREENTNDDSLLGILQAMEQLDAPVIYPVHSRNGQKIQHIIKNMDFQNMVFTEPVGYLESICILDHAKMVITDSGGLQRKELLNKLAACRSANNMTDYMKQYKMEVRKIG